MQQTMATAMGHLDQERQGLQSTKNKALDFILARRMQSIRPNIRTLDAFSKAD